MPSFFETVSKLSNQLAYEAGYETGKYASDAAFKRYIDPRLQSAVEISKGVDHHAYGVGQAVRNFEMPELPLGFDKFFEKMPGSEAVIDKVLEVMPDIYSKMPRMTLISDIEGLNLPKISIPNFDAEAAIGATSSLIEKLKDFIPNNAIKGFYEGFIARGKRNAYKAKLITEKQILPAVSRGGQNFLLGVANKRPIKPQGSYMFSAGGKQIGTLDGGEKEVDALMGLYDKEHRGQIIDFEGEGRMPGRGERSLPKAIKEKKTGYFELTNSSGAGWGTFSSSNLSSVSTDSDDRSPLLDSGPPQSASVSRPPSLADSFLTTTTSSSSSSSLTSDRHLQLPPPVGSSLLLPPPVGSSPTTTTSSSSSSSSSSNEPPQSASVSRPPSLADSFLTTTTSSSSSSSLTSDRHLQLPPPVGSSLLLPPPVGSSPTTTTSSSSSSSSSSNEPSQAASVSRPPSTEVGDEVSSLHPMPPLGSGSLPGAVGPQSEGQSIASSGNRLSGNLNTSGVGSSMSQQPSFLSQARGSLAGIFSRMMNNFRRGAGYHNFVEMEGSASMFEEASDIASRVQGSVSAPPSTEAGREADSRGQGAEGLMDKKFMGLMYLQMGIGGINDAINRLSQRESQEVGSVIQMQQEEFNMRHQQHESNEQENAQNDQNRYNEGLQWLQMRRGSRRF